MFDWSDCKAAAIWRSDEDEIGGIEVQAVQSIYKNGDIDDKAQALLQRIFASCALHWFCLSDLTDWLTVFAIAKRYPEN